MAALGFGAIWISTLGSEIDTASSSAKAPERSPARGWSGSSLWPVFFIAAYEQLFVCLLLGVAPWHPL